MGHIPGHEMRTPGDVVGNATFATGMLDWVVGQIQYLNTLIAAM
jgi:hypothetical protein